MLLALLIHLPLGAQKQASIWYFGQHAGLDFRNGEPIALTDGALNTFEGSATIADEEGNLLFYTDGVTVWNRLHQPMPNGRNLWGSYTTTQTLIVPKPGSDPIYYIFTASPNYDRLFGTGTDSVGFHYTVVDMNLDGGRGDVTQKNILLFKNTTEKVTAVHHANGNDIWVVAHEWGNSIFRSYLVTASGINTAPVISNIGSIHEGGGFEVNDNYNAIGQMKLSPDGTRIAVTLAYAKKIEIFSFDSYSGELNLQITSLGNIGNQILTNYSVEFSPNCKLIYFSVLGGCGSNDSDNPSELWQYSIDTNQLVKIKSFIGSINAMQLGLNGKIYLSQCNEIKSLSNLVGAINNPSHSGKGCNYITNAIDLETGRNTLGLPNFIQSYFLFPEPIIEMPNVFTPNGDIYNPVFKPIVFENILEAKLTIINRWGKEIFNTDDIEQGWNGENTPSGVYYWRIVYEGKNGKLGTSKGWVHLLR
jgi:gliding motility-associated-like protein